MLNNKWYNKGKMMIEDVTNSPKDWEDFWYNSEDIFQGETNNIMVLNYTSIHNKHWEDYNEQSNGKVD